MGSLLRWAVAAVGLAWSVGCSSEARPGSGRSTDERIAQAAAALGETCFDTSDCSGGACVDGVCCDGPCDGSCEACTALLKGSGSDGSCGPVALGSDPDAECATQGAATCGTTGACDGAGACELHPAGTPCASSCTGGVVTDSECDGNGLCASAGTTACAPYLCAGSACGTACTSDAQCVASHHCRVADGTCQPDGVPGDPCSAASGCASGFCVDGVCCATACGGLCQACAAAKKGGGADGTCGPVAAASDPDAECADQGAASCGTSGACNGAGACALYAAGASCGAATCTSGAASTSTCDGNGTCTLTTTPCAPYTCGPNACKASCAGALDCVASSHCRASDGTCQPDLAQGAACSAADQCQSGFCVDGVCCASGCTGQCQACSAAKKGSGIDGACGNVAIATDPNDDCSADGTTTCGKTGLCNGNGACALYAPGTGCVPPTCAGATQTSYACDGTGACKPAGSQSCGLYQCQGTLCGTTCTTSNDCVGSAHCAAGACRADLPLGGACGAAGDCASGHCVDGVCCDQACTNSCRACSAAKKGGGSDGTCGNVASGTDPDDDCAPETSASCGRDGTCNGSGVCHLYAPGTPCGATTCNASGVSGLVCDGFGVCRNGTAASCAPYQCSGGGCLTSCSTSSDCAVGSYCTASGTCAASLVGGSACSLDDECVSGHCVDSVCCDSACAGMCQACTAARKGTGADGVCGAAAAGLDPRDDCAQSSSSTCGTDGTCDGAGACRVYSAGTDCGADNCSGNAVESHACNGFGACISSIAATCAPYACSAGACVTSCGSDGDCSLGSRCASGVCTTASSLGAACAGDGECQSGHCVDGVCCDVACGGQCEACDVATSLGTCSPAYGAPHGARPACAAGSANAPCQARACDGAVSRTQCDAYVGSSVTCGQTACAAGVETHAGTCDGQGACNAGGTSTPCEPFACGATSCLTSCSRDADCAAGRRCDVDTGSCLSTGGATCLDEHTARSASGIESDCSPLRCSGGVCLTACNASTECVNGYRCEGHVCSVVPLDVSGDDGGCGCRAAPTRGTGTTLPLAALACALAAARITGRDRKRPRRARQ